MLGYYYGPVKIKGYNPIRHFQATHGGRLGTHDIIVQNGNPKEDRLINGNNPLECTVFRLINDPIGPDRSYDNTRRSLRERPENVTMLPDPIMEDESHSHFGNPMQTTRRISAGEELYYDYGVPYWVKMPGYKQTRDKEKTADRKRKKAEIDREISEKYERKMDREPRYYWFGFKHGGGVRSPTRADQEPGIIQKIIDLYQVPKRRRDE